MDILAEYMVLIGLPGLQESSMTPHIQYGDMLFVFMLEFLAMTDFHWAEVLTKSLLRNEYYSETP